MKKILRLLPVLLLAACGQGGAPPPTAGGPKVQDLPVQMETTGEADPNASTDAVFGGTFSSWQGDYPKSLNGWLDESPIAQIVSGLLFQSLLELHSTEDRPIGDIAESWDISPDKKVYTFHLNPAAKWSDGVPVTAEDVQFYYDVIMNPHNLTSPYRVDLSRFARPEVIDAHTVRITANQAHWKNFWAAGGFTPFPKHVWANLDFNNINFDFPVVDGPYKLAPGDVKTNRSVKLTRRGDWWGRIEKYNEHKFNFDYLVFKSTQDRTKALEMLKTGEFDQYAIYTAKLWAVDIPAIPQVQKNWVVAQEVFNAEPRSFQGFAMNLRRPIFQDLKVRQALSYLLNRELMNTKLMYNQYFLLNSYFPALYPDDINPDMPTTPYDPDKARELLKEAGWQVGSDGILAKDGQPFAITILHYESADMRHLNIYMQDLKAVGINVNVEIVSEATFTKRVDNHEFDMIWQAWGDSRLRDPEAEWSSKTADDIATQNIGGFKDAEVDKLIDEQKTEMDLGKRNEILKKIDARLMALCPYVLMWQTQTTKVLYWDKFGTPPYVFSKYGNEGDAYGYWWYDQAKAAALDDAMKRDMPLPALPAEVHYPQ